MKQEAIISKIVKTINKKQDEDFYGFIKVNFQKGFINNIVIEKKNGCKPKQFCDIIEIIFWEV